MVINGRILEKKGEFYLKIGRKDGMEAGLCKGKLVEMEIRKKHCW